MKRLVIGWALLLSLTIFLPPSSVHAISLNFVPSAQNVSLGSSAQVAIKISGLGDSLAPSLGTYDLNVNFNPAVLSFNTVSFGDPILGDQLDLFSLGSLIITTPGAGYVNLFELSLDSAADLDSLQASDFILATLTFDTLGVGTSPLSFTVNALGDSNGDSLTADNGSGSVTVDAARSVPEPSTLLLLGSGLAGLVAFRRRQQQL
jgi:hypothetical protein